MSRLDGIGTAILIAASCNGRPTLHLSLAQLVAQQAAYLGRVVATEGTVRTFVDASGRYQVLEDEHLNRVRIEPSGAAAPYATRRVKIVGLLAFDARAGRSIQTTEIAPIDGGSSATQAPR
jgi:hypothetical protein